MKFCLKMMLPISLCSCLLQLVFCNNLFCPQNLCSTTIIYHTVPNSTEYQLESISNYSQSLILYPFTRISVTSSNLTLMPIDQILITRPYCTNSLTILLSQPDVLKLVSTLTFCSSQSTVHWTTLVHLLLMHCLFIYQLCEIVSLLMILSRRLL